MKIILDTNALMAIAEFRIDIFSELERACDIPYTVYVLEGTVQELEKIQHTQRATFSRAAKLALALLRAKHVPVIREEGNVDDLLVNHSHAGDLVLTQDRELKRRLSKPYLTIRQKKMIILVG